jgi:hypothetical protein
MLERAVRFLVFGMKFLSAAAAVLAAVFAYTLPANAG